jgi:hypothetical protein
MCVDQWPFFWPNFCTVVRGKKIVCELYKLQTTNFWGILCESPHILRDNSQKSLHLDAEFIEVRRSLQDSRIVKKLYFLAWALLKDDHQSTELTRGASQCGLAIYIKKYLKAKEELRKLTYFTIQKYNLPKIL